MAIGAIAKLGDVLLDIVEADNPSLSMEITEKPVERGQDIADHMKESPSTISISGIVVGDDAAKRLEMLRNYAKNKNILTYINRIVYDNMAIESLDTIHDRDIGNGFKFEITLKNVRIAKAKEVTIVNVPPALQTKDKDAASTKTKSTTNSGKKQTKAKSKKDDEALALANKIREHTPQ